MRFFRSAYVRVVAAAAITIAIAFAIVRTGDYDPLPLNIAGCAVILLSWAVAFHLRIVAGASMGLLIAAVTPVCDASQLGPTVLYTIIGAIAGLCWNRIAVSKGKK